jgi:hypothetical protein
VRFIRAVTGTFAASYDYVALAAKRRINKPKEGDTDEVIENLRTAVTLIKGHSKW